MKCYKPILIKQLCMVFVLCCFSIVLPVHKLPAEEFRLSEPVVCSSVKGFRDYVKLEPAELTTFDKLQVYVEPYGYSTKTEGEKLRAELVQGVKLRAKGAKKLIFEREELFRYDPVIDSSGQQIYLAATIGFKNLSPGPYLLELETMDKATKPERKVLQIIEFQIVAPEKSDRSPDGMKN